MLVILAVLMPAVLLHSAPICHVWIIFAPWEQDCSTGFVASLLVLADQSCLSQRRCAQHFFQSQLLHTFAQRGKQISPNFMFTAAASCTCSHSSSVMGYHSFSFSSFVPAPNNCLWTGARYKLRSQDKLLLLPTGWHFAGSAVYTVHIKDKARKEG